NSARVGRINRAEKRVTSMVAVMVVAFMIAWTPYAVFALIDQFGPTDLITPALGVLPALIAKSSICYNPIIYVGMNTQFRAAFNRVRNKDYADNKTTHTINTKETLSLDTSKQLVECSFDFCSKKSRLKILLKGEKPTSRNNNLHLNHHSREMSEGGGDRSSSTNAGPDRSPMQLMLQNLPRNNGHDDRSHSSFDGAKMIQRSDFELSVINNGESILIKSNTFRSNLV
ncbi:melanopsin-A-like, partial [Uranotaenia lowii]|uniref:melanopsin-A-like n=1 Tax=Uranotaenia lowii TaxID=190385 RepID=UPI0024789FC4